MSDRPLHRPGIHEGKSPARRRKNVKGSPEQEGDRVHKPVTRGGGRGKQDKLYPELPGDRDTGGDVTEEESDSGAEHIQITDDEVSPNPNVGKRKGKSPGGPAPAKPPRDIPDGRADNRGSKLWLCLPVVAVILIAVGIYQYLFDVIPQPIEPPTEEPNIDYYELFKPKFIDLQRQFPSQNERFWKVLSSPLRRILKAENSDYPAILLIGVPVNGTKTAACFGKTLMERVHSVYSSKAEFYINAIDLLKSSPAHTKLELDNNLKQVLSAGKGVVLDHIESLPAEGALLLHGYCDGDNAPFKTSVIVLMFHTDKDFANLNDRTFEDHLTELWQDGLGPDEMPALRARVANSVVIVKPEANVIC